MCLTALPEPMGLVIPEAGGALVLNVVLNIIWARISLCDKDPIYNLYLLCSYLVHGFIALNKGLKGLRKSENC